MLSGRRLDLLDPSPVDVEIEDIAHGLARVARWNGQTQGDHAFSVAQHSLVVEAILGRLEPQFEPRCHSRRKREPVSMRRSCVPERSTTSSPAWPTTTA